MSIHEEKLQAVFPVTSTPDSCDTGNHDNMNMAHDSCDTGNHDNMNMAHDSCDDTEPMEKRKGGNDSHAAVRKRRQKNNKRHVCNLCNKSLTYASSLKTHMLTHTGDKPFVCVLCGKAFNLEYNLKIHELIHTGEKPFLCDVCSKTFTQASHLKAHKRIHTGERPYKCPHCEADFNQSNHVRKHVRTIHSDNSRYDTSEMVFPMFDDLGRSRRSHSDGKTDAGGKSVRSSYPENQSLIHTGVPAVRSDLIQPRPGEASHQVASYCEDDGEMDEDGDRESYGDLQPGANRHSEEHPSTTLMPSQTANQSTEGKPGQNPERTREEVLHSLIKSKQVNYMTLPVTSMDEVIYCEECDEELPGDCPQHDPYHVADSSPNRRNPSSSETTSSAPQPSCNDRPSPHKSANTSGSLLSQDRSHVCQRCSAAFVMFNSLKLHMMFIHGEKLQAVLPVNPIPDSCDSDNHYTNMEHNNFNDRKSVEKKKGDIDSNDTGDKEKASYQRTCNVCFESFTDLNQHMPTHTGHKQFECCTYSKSFTHACNLKTPESTHTAQKSFVCDVCDKAFTQGSYLKEHKRIHTGERPYKCPHCDADFSQYNHVQKHIRTVHVGSRRFVCRLCGGTFSRTTDLYKHLKVHSSGKRPLQSHCPQNRTMNPRSEELACNVPVSPDENVDTYRK